MWDAKRIDDEVTAFGKAMCKSQQFDLAVEEAERWIVEQMPIRQCNVDGEPTSADCGDEREPNGLCAPAAAGKEVR